MEVKLSALKSACNSVPSPGAGWCAKWVTQVFAKCGVSHYGNAEDHVNECCTKSVSSIKAGMVVATDDSPTSKYGHIGIYLGNNTVMDNVGYIRTTTLDWWKSYYSKVTPVKCGWFGGVEVVDNSSSTTSMSGGFNLSTLPSLNKNQHGSKCLKATTCLQAALNAQGYGSLVTDGYYGSATASAVAKFQKEKGLTSDRVCGPKTWAKLFGV